MSTTKKTPDVAPGSVLGGYRVESLIGRGGMASVYLAEHVADGSEVALKVLAPELTEDVNFRSRFLRESRVVAALEHPAIRRIYDAVEEDGLVYLALQYIDGRALDAIVREDGPLSAPAVVAIVEQIAAALDVTHANGLVHRDVKPSNVLVDGDGHAYLTDFGVAWQTSDAETTRPGEFFGTLEWLAPEQVQGRPLDQRTDIYALGAVLFFALTGHEPYERDSEVAVIYAHLSDPIPRVSSYTPENAALDSVVERALAKQPADRFGSAGDLARAARAAIIDFSLGLATPIPVPPPPLQLEPSPPVELVADVVRLQLRRQFEYVHEPLESNHCTVPFLGNQTAVEALKERIRHSSGGAFLVTGFRGVGKTTIIRRALRELREETGSDTDVLHVSLNVARPLSTEALLFEVVRRLFEELTDRGVLASLPDDVQRAVIVAYTRTSLSFKETRSSASERSRSLGMSLESLPMLGKLGPSLDFSSKQTDSLATEAAFLAYSDADVEHDFLRIVGLLRRNGAAAAPARRRLLRRIRQRIRGASPASSRWNGRLVVVVDELDKLTATAEGVQALESILNGLKNLLTTRGVHFLFVAGPDLHDMALRESQRGSSVYESVFGWQHYVPCVWGAADELLAAVVSNDSRDGGRPAPDEWYKDFRDYLAFKARGIPRLLLLELNSFVRWDGTEPIVSLDAVDARRVDFYAGLQRILRDFMEPREESGAVFAIPIDEDRWRLGAYYVVDWILRCRDRAFTVEELVSAQETPVDPNLVLSPTKVRELLDHLVARGVLVQVSGRADQTYIGDAPDANAVAYRVVEDIYEKLGRFERWSERERFDLAPPANEAAAQPWADAGALATAGAGRYELRRELGRSSQGSVYRAYDSVLGREVAVKLLDVRGLLADQTARNRFRRAAEVAATLKHPNLVETLDTFEDPDGRLGIVLQLVDGTPLTTLLAWGPLHGAEAVRITDSILDALDYLHRNGLARFDLKPSSIILDESRTPLISDVGLAKVVDETLASASTKNVTRAGVMIGTPRYMAPEQAAGGDVDIRTDLHAVGLILYEMLTGRPAQGDETDNPIETLRRIVEQDVDVDDVDASQELRQVIRRALARKPDERFADPHEMRLALAQTPEARALAA